jgi:hypothetical protein
LEKSLDSEDQSDLEAPQQVKSKDEEIKVMELNYEFFSQVIVKEELLKGVTGTLGGQTGPVGVDLKVSMAEGSSHETFVRASIALVNKLVFDVIQEVQQTKRPRTNQEVYDYVKTLDKELDTYAEIAFKIKDRDAR